MKKLGTLLCYILICCMLVGCGNSKKGGQWYEDNKYSKYIPEPDFDVDEDSYFGTNKNKHFEFRATGIGKDNALDYIDQTKKITKMNSYKETDNDHGKEVVYKSTVKSNEKIEIEIIYSYDKDKLYVDVYDRN